MKLNMILTQILIFLPILVAIFIYIINNKKVNYIVFPTQFLLTLVIIKMWSLIMDNGVMTFTLGQWHRSIGIEFSIDNLSMLFMSMANVMWWVLLVYSWQQKKSDFKFIFFLTILQGCFSAFLMVNDLFTFFVLIEIITILSSILILYKKDGNAIKAALYYLLFNSFGMMVYLCGVMILYIKVGSLNITTIKLYLVNSQFHDSEFTLIHVSFACLFVAMCVKAALFPVYDWLPRAHTAAPTNISALLSGLLVKTGVLGLIRIIDIYQIETFYHMIFILGLITSISSMVYAISQKDIKGILAFSTISQIGLAIMALSMASEVGLVASYLQLFNHFIFKSILFLSVGIIINEYGYRRIDEIRGVARAYPLLTVCMLISIFAVTGAPFFIGSISKTMIKMSLVTTWQISVFRLINLGTIVYFIKFSAMFFGKKPMNKKNIGFGQLMGIIILTVLCVIAYFKELLFIPQFMAINSGTMSPELLKVVSYTQSNIYGVSYLLEYILFLIIGYGLYIFIVKPNFKVWHHLRRFRLKFQDAIVLLILFLMMVLIYV